MAFFSQHGIEVDVRDVSACAQNMQRMVEVSGQSLTPTLEYGEFVCADFSVAELLEALELVPDIRSELGLADNED